MKLSLLALAVGFAAVTRCAVAAPIDDAKALLAKGNAQAAVDAQQPSLDQNLSNADFNYVLGIALLDAGKAGEALFAFERVLAIEPGNALARAELARGMIVIAKRRPGGFLRGFQNNAHRDVIPSALSKLRASR